ncbi:MAG: 3-methyl-2-oxobutanoate dehydrogenase (2-methylpropanoyl-transferring) subunit alpha [Planctomycetia bacterium]|nr:MAG: 3-methyl-2-oxobutanoate dehydrogenase (2-methylpropanoyl-transferring) subunit alpha [Planctomycetia bacterium]
MSERDVHVDHFRRPGPDAAARSDPAPRWWVPAAAHRPGDEPRFSPFRQRPADLSKPDALAAADQLGPHAAGLVRVLEDDGAAAGPWDPHLSASTLRKGLELMVLARQFDTRLITMQRQGRLSFYVESKGEEAVAAAAGLALRFDDLLFPAYRQPSLFLARGMSLVDMISHCIGNLGDPIKGRQMPTHYSWKKGNIVSISSPVGTQFPQAVGAAMAAARRPGGTDVVATWIGDGTTAQGDFHYGLVFASVYRAPVILNVVNNQWAISTHCSQTQGGPTFAGRAGAFGLPGIRVDGNDFLAVFAVTAWAAQRARSGGGATLIELVTYRAAAHSSSDDPKQYRPDDEVRLWPGGDPVARLADHMTRIGVWSAGAQQTLEETVRQQVAAAFKEAERFGSFPEGPFHPAECLLEDVYQKAPWHIEQQRRQLRSA